MHRNSEMTLPGDPCAEWTALSDEDLTVDDIQSKLKNIPHNLWVAAACYDRLVLNVEVQRALLEVGLERTHVIVESCNDVLDGSTGPVINGGDNDPEVDEVSPETSEQRRCERLTSYFTAHPAEAQLARLRAALLERLDRLNTFLEITDQSGGNTQGGVVADAGEWEDDPWAEADASESPSQDRPRAPVELPFLSLTEFLTDELVDIACLLACQEQLSALPIILNRHGSVLWPHRFIILGSIPEYVHVLEYLDFLPRCDPSTNKEQIPSFNPWRHEQDLAETPEVLNALHSSNAEGSQIHDTVLDTDSHPESLSEVQLTEWYRRRVDDIISCSGMIDIALEMIQHGASQGVPDLDELGEELSLLSRLVYNSHGIETGKDEDWTLNRWRAMAPSEVVRAYLAHSTPSSVVGDVSRLVMPYLFVLEARAERAGHSDPELPNRLLYEYILTAPLEIAAAIFEASKPTLPAAQRLVRIDEDVARLALACLYGSSSLDEWGTMSRIFECMPAWDISMDDDDQADEADSTILSLGAYVTPTTSRPQCSASDLLVFFKPLPLASLSRALDILDVHLESGEILARWNVPAPLRWFLQSHSDAGEQQARANKMARQAGGRGEDLDSQEEWSWMLDDMLKLCITGETGLRGAFGLLDGSEIKRIFLSGLVSSGKFNIVKSLLRSSRNLSIDAGTIEDICLSCSREFYDNASSGNYKFGDMKLAYECLDVPPPSDRIIREKEFIEATSRLSSFNIMSRPGIPLSPLEIRLTKDRLSLVSRVLSSNADAYKHMQVILDLVHKLGFRNDVVAEVKTLAMLADTALQAEDFSKAYENSERMIETVSRLRSSSLLGGDDPVVAEAGEVCWVACFQLGRQSEFDDTQKKLSLLGRALELCPADKIHDVLTAWRRLEKEDLDEREERLSKRQRIHSPSTERPKRNGASAGPRSPPLSERMASFHFPTSPLMHAPDAAALANRALSSVGSVAAGFAFGGTRGRRTGASEDTGRARSGSGSGFGQRHDGADVSAQASRVLSKGIGWLLGADEE